MMEQKLGSNLSDGTEVYYMNCNARPYRDVIKLNQDQDYTLQLTYLFDLEDGLWATSFSRQEWRLSPHLHPGFTLFSFLYKNLEI